MDFQVHKTHETIQSRLPGHGRILEARWVRDLGSTTRINVSLDFGLLKAIDDEARQRGQTRSAFIASAVRNELINS